MSNSRKPYLVYLNKRNDVWVRDAYQWMMLNGYEEGDFQEILSEVAFGWALDKGKLNDVPVYFVNEILVEREKPIHPAIVGLSQDELKKVDVSLRIAAILKAYTQHYFHKELSDTASPRWLVLYTKHNHDNDSLRLYLQSTQDTSIQIDIPSTTEEVIALSKALDSNHRELHQAWFKNFRNEYLKANYPNINWKL